MQLVDVNVFVYAFRQDSADHAVATTWLEELVNRDEPFGISELVLSSFLRIVTNPRVFVAPSTLDLALAFTDQIRNRPNSVTITPQAAHWDISTRLCREIGAAGSLVPDAYFAALAIESNCEWISTDRDYHRFSGLQWRLPW